ncbi:hypothetical protein Tsubulata_000227 [Turnera subulata]|uniref:START domain-containing protein n=1 Tax=Turnera subulata TaxID=218843 RepID=A0A9Q0JEV4_9ROSI|nr:hypothetical protein Tsubulata_000227 [Turnera subulata]
MSPGLVRDFFWDDEFRLTWDNMLVYCKTLDVFPETGTMIVHWIKKGTPHPSLPKQKKPKRVEVYYSSWSIRTLEQRDGEHGTGCEVLLFHHEDISIPKRLVSMAVRAAMWSLVKRLDTGIQVYNRNRANGSAPSNYAFMAQLTTKISPSMAPLPRTQASDTETQKVKGRKNVLRWFVVGTILLGSGVWLSSYWRGHNRRNRVKQPLDAEN